MCACSKDMVIGSLMALVVVLLALLFVKQNSKQDCTDAINRKNSQLDKLLDDKREVDINLDRCKSDLRSLKEELRGFKDQSIQLKECRETAESFRKEALSVLDQCEERLQKCDSDLNGYGQVVQARLNLFGMFHIGAGLSNPLSSHQLDNAGKRRKKLE